MIRVTKVRKVITELDLVSHQGGGGGGYNMLGKQLKGMANGTSFLVAVTKQQLVTKLSLSGGTMTGNLDMNNNRIYNVAQPDGDNQPATKM